MFAASYFALRGTSVANLLSQHSYKVIIYVEQTISDVRDMMYIMARNQPFTGDSSLNLKAKSLIIKTKLDTLSALIIDNPLLLLKMQFIRDEINEFDKSEINEGSRSSKRLIILSAVITKLDEIIDREYEYLGYRATSYKILSEKLLIMQTVLAAALIASIFLFFRAKNSKEKILRKSIHLQRELAKEVINVQEYERERIARDLHDAIGSTLAAIKIILYGEPLLIEKIPEVLGLINQASSDVRNISHDLVPPQFEYAGLETTLSNYYNRLGRNCPIHFQFDHTGNNETFSSQESLILYRVIMELTNNIFKHSAASKAFIHLFYHGKHLEITVKDNGKGFSRQNVAGIGLKNVKARVEYLGGKLVINSDDHGTTVIVQVPFNQGEALQP
jgi:signal transduction histidine kinase